MKKLISIIVPVYNVEKYLIKCLESIVHQTYKNLEIILVDDGSTDLCGKICDEYALKDNRIKVIHKKNGGVSEAKNCGIEISKGDYLMFIDGDDFVDKSICEKLITISRKNNVDISMCDMYRVIGEKIINEPFCSKLKRNKILNGKLVLKEFFRKYSTELYSGCNKLYKREIFFNRNKIRFPVGKVFEDMHINYKLYFMAKNIIIISDRLYYYVKRNNSITTRRHTERDVLSRLDFIKDIKLFSKNVNSDIKECIQVAILRIYFEILYFCLKDRIFDDRFFIKISSKILSMKKIYRNKNIPKKIFLEIFLLKIKMWIPYRLLLIKIRGR